MSDGGSDRGLNSHGHTLTSGLKIFAGYLFKSRNFTFIKFRQNEKD